VKNKIVLLILIVCFSILLSACEKNTSEPKDGATITKIETTDFVDSNHENSECEETPIYQYGYINVNGEMIIEPKFFTYQGRDNVIHNLDFHDGMAKFIDENSNIGFIDTTGKIVIEPIYTDAYDFYNDYAWVEIDGVWGKIDKLGNIVVDFKFEYWIKFPNDEWIAFYEDGLWGFADQNGNIIIEPEYSNVCQFVDDYALVETGGGTIVNDNGTKSYQFGLWGSIDKNNNIIVEPTYCLLTLAQGYSDFNNGLMLVWDEHKTQFYINTKCEKVITQFRDGWNFSDGFACVQTEQYSGEYIYINTEGNKAIDKIFYSYNSFSDELARVRLEQNGKYGFINISGDVVIEPQFSNVSDFSDGLASFLEEGMYGYIDKTGEIVIPAQYKSASDFYNGMALVDGIIIDKNGNVISEPPNGYRFYGFDGFSDELAIVVKEN